MKAYFIHLILIISFFSSCDNDNDFQKEDSTKTPELVQVSVIDAIVQGIYDGYYPIGGLKELGDMGIGTFDALDGEMIVLNDTIYQVLFSGEVVTPSDTVLTPYAAVAVWQSDTVFDLNNITYDLLKSEFSNYFPTSNIFYAVMINGHFSYVKTRSVPRQEKPYPPLVEVTAKQSEFEFTDTYGTIIGFYCPDYASGISTTGFHLHFLTNDRKGGGHLLEYTLTDGKLEMCYLFNYKLILPEGGDFFGGDFTIDRSDDLEEAES
ncbi:MAG: acetolactate decarboxylase [Prolixibacteraceae bacterium]|nr:acetolactate decarboxylase [Prolixibacteraceae bacterium]